MLDLSDDLNTSISGETTTLARLLQITNAIGAVFYFTDCDIDLLVGSNTYKSHNGFDVSAIVTNLGTNLGTCSVDLLMADDGINKAMIEAGLLDGAEVIVSIVDWLFPTRGAIEKFRGNIQTIEYQDGLIATFDVEPLLSRDLQLNVDLVSSNCRVDLGSTKCGIDIEALSKTGTVATVSNLQQFDTDLTDNDSTWDIGLILFTSGNNDGVALEIGQYLNASGQITLQLLAPYTIQTGDTFKIYPGCDKTAVMCSSIYKNIINMRAEPFGLNAAAAGSIGGVASQSSGGVPTPASQYAVFTFHGTQPVDNNNYKIFRAGSDITGGATFLQFASNQLDPTTDLWTYHKLSAMTGYFMSTGANPRPFNPGGPSFYPADSQFFVAAQGIISNLAYGSPTPDRDGEAGNTGAITASAAIAVSMLSDALVYFNTAPTSLTFLSVG